MTPSFAEYPAGVISAMGRKARKVICSYGPAFFTANLVSGVHLPGNCSWVACRLTRLVRERQH